MGFHYFLLVAWGLGLRMDSIQGHKISLKIPDSISKKLMPPMKNIMAIMPSIFPSCLLNLIISLSQPTRPA